MKKVYTFNQLKGKGRQNAINLYNWSVEREAEIEEIMDYYSWGNGEGGEVLFYKNGEEIEEIE